MLKWFKQKDRREKCKHYKEFGEPYPINMVELVRFSPYKTDNWGYGISECTECGHRAFACVPCHLMTQNMCETIDLFIGHKINWDTFKDFLSDEMAWHKER